ncbi:MAG: LysR family transcriptional regulator [Gammaproteobacteria bacterium]
MDKWAEMHAFVAVVEHNGFAAAARALDLVPSAVSRLITHLEVRLGVRLLNRTTRRLSLTEAGERFYIRCKAILDEIDASEADVMGLQQVPKGRLRISCVVAIAERYMAGIMATFMQRYPAIEIEVLETDRPVDLIADVVDIALVAGKLEDSSYRARQLTTFQRIIAAAPAYLAKHGTPQTPVDLKRHNCLVFSAAPHLQNWPFVSASGECKSYQVTGNFKASGAELILSAALAGIGICRLADFMLQPHLDSGRLVALLQDAALAEAVPLSIVFAPGLHLSPKVRVFIDHLAEQFATGLHLA